MISKPTTVPHPTWSPKRAQIRATQARQLAARVTVPVSSEAPVRQPVSKGVALLKGVGFAVAAILLHGSIVGSLAAFGNGAEAPHEPAPTRVVFRSMSAPPPVAPKAEAPLAAPVEAPEEEPVELLPASEPTPAPVKQRRRAPKPLSADPVDVAATPEPAQERRRIVGLSLSSTVNSGAGPRFAVGNTRMGETDKVAKVDKIGKLGADQVNDNRSGVGGTGTGTSEGPNRVATRLPTASKSFEKPKRLSSGSLPYPPALKSRGIEGTVVVLIVIDIKGQVQKVRVIKSSGYPEFDNAAKDAANDEMFSPARRDGAPVEYNLKYTYRFRLKGA